MNLNDILDLPKSFDSGLFDMNLYNLYVDYIKILKMLFIESNIKVKMY